MRDAELADLLPTVEPIDVAGNNPSESEVESVKSADRSEQIGRVLSAREEATAAFLAFVAAAGRAACGLAELRGAGLGESVGHLLGGAVPADDEARAAVAVIVGRLAAAGHLTSDWAAGIDNTLAGR